VLKDVNLGGVLGVYGVCAVAPGELGCGLGEGVLNSNLG
jgi:hypothetical protein